MEQASVCCVLLSVQRRSFPPQCPAAPRAWTASGEPPLHGSTATSNRRRAGSFLHAHGSSQGPCTCRKPGGSVPSSHRRSVPLRGAAGVQEHPNPAAGGHGGVHQWPAGPLSPHSGGEGGRACCSLISETVACWRLSAAAPGCLPRSAAQSVQPGTCQKLPRDSDATDRSLLAPCCCKLMGRWSASQAGCACSCR